MFFDNVNLRISSGNGGKGCVSFHREKFITQGGPDGGDGGRGGDVVFYADKNAHTLSNFRGKKHLKAENGKDGGSRKKFGKSGKNIRIKVPVGTQIIDTQTNEILADLDEEKEVVLLKGGKGGLGNTHFASPTKQRPSYAQPGIKGETKDVRLELKLIADLGLVGLPNAGKSTLISTITNAQAKIGSYAFTTLIPQLGVANLDAIRSFVVADIPGLIEGAHQGKGLGIKFLRHIERTKFLLFILDRTNQMDIKVQFQTLHNELCSHSKILCQKPFGIAISKMDLGLRVDTSSIANDAFFVMEISSVQQKNIKELKEKCFKVIDENCL